MFTEEGAPATPPAASRSTGPGYIMGRGPPLDARKGTRAARILAGAQPYLVDSWAAATVDPGCWRIGKEPCMHLVVTGAYLRLQADAGAQPHTTVRVASHILHDCRGAMQRDFIRVSALIECESVCRSTGCAAARPSCRSGSMGR